MLEPKQEVVKFQNFQNVWEVAAFSLQKVSESAASGLFPHIFCCAKSPVFKVKQNLEAQHNLKRTLNHQKA